MASVTLTPEVDSLFVGAGLQLAVTLRDAGNRVLTGRAVTWSSSNPSLAAVSKDGLVIGLYQGGPVTIVATSEGVTGTATVRVRQPQAPSMAEARSVLDSTTAAFYRFAAQTNGDAAQALLYAADRMAADPRVRAVHVLDTTSMHVELQTGMHTMFRYNEVGADGLSVSRGGGGATSGAALTRFRRASNAITNRKVLFCAPMASEFYKAGQLEVLADIARNAGLGLQVTVLRDEQCTWQAVASFGNYGLVILDTHGFPVGFELGTRIEIDSGPSTDATFRVKLDAQLGAGTYDGLASGDFGTLRTAEVGPDAGRWWERDFSEDVRHTMWATSRFIRKLQLPNTVVFGNMCHSGARGGPPNYWPQSTSLDWIQPSFMSTGLISYFGYAFLDGTSDIVQNDHALMVEEMFLKSLAVEGDSTGTAALDENGELYLLNQAPGTPDIDRGSGPLTFKPKPYRPLYFLQDGAPDFSYVQVFLTPSEVSGEYGEPVSFTADDKGTAPTQAIYEWDFGDGTPPLQVAGSPQVEHTFQLPPGAGPCSTKDYLVTVTLLNNATGTPVPVAQARGTARLEGDCPAWVITAISDPGGEFDDEHDHFKNTVISPMLRRILVTPEAGLLTLTQEPDQEPGQDPSLALVVRRTGAWTLDDCCAVPPTDTTDVLLIGPGEMTSNSVGPFFAGWETNFFTQSTTDLATGTMQAQLAFGIVTYPIQDGGNQDGPSGGVRFTATRNGDVMTGSIIFYLWFIEGDSGEVELPATAYTFPFTARRPQ